MSQDNYWLTRIKETRFLFAQRPERAPLVEGPTNADELLRSSIRQSARSRISGVLRQLRAAHGLTYEDIHDATGLSQQLLFDIEFKDQRLTLEQLDLLTQLYNYSLSDILGVDIDLF